MRSMLASMPPEEIVKILATSHPKIRRSLAGLFLNGLGDIFSGIYVKCCGYEGVLTAWHCLKEWQEQPISFIVLEQWHSFMVSTCYLERVCIDYSPDTGRPDLAFIIIKEDGITRNLKRLGIEFYDLEANWVKINEVLFEPFAKGTWAIGGVPEEKIFVDTAMAKSSKTSDPCLQAQEIMLRTNFVKREFIGNYDYLTLKPITNMGQFPKRFRGMSGGGIWYLEIKTTSDKSFEVEPYLAGMLCRDNKEATLEEGFLYREVEGHGWDSIYAHVRNALENKRAKEAQN